MEAYGYFNWFNKNQSVEILGYVPNLSILSFNGTMMFTQGDKKLFIESSSNEINKLFLKEPLKNYTLYLMANLEVKNNNSKIEKYRKVWKALQTEWNLEGFKFGPEIEVNKNDNCFYTSIASFKTENISKSVELVSMSPKKFAIFASCNKDTLTEARIKEIFDSTNILNDSKNLEINYYLLSLYLCPKGDIVFRLGTSSEETEIAMIYDNDVIQVTL
ncbi:hypothetical protein [Dehalobacter sp. TBBPA1]|uniref:hypothetical protein n=1 Tax=Dehalobacter sp. TBBPA1 TaxID=3235037 RepID=UPI0034A3414D